MRVLENDVWFPERSRAFSHHAGGEWKLVDGRKRAFYWAANILSWRAWTVRLSIVTSPSLIQLISLCIQIEQLMKWIGGVRAEVLFFAGDARLNTRC